MFERFRGPARDGVCAKIRRAVLTWTFGLRLLTYIYRQSFRRTIAGLESTLSPRILIVDDNSVARTTIRSFLDWHDFPVCGEAIDGKDAIKKVKELKPDIVLLDINMPGMNGIQTAAKIQLVSRRTKIVFLTIHNIPG